MSPASADVKRVQKVESSWAIYVRIKPYLRLSRAVPVKP